ncbi:MAG: signal peptidase II, partial [Gemmatimonadales bacterium]
MPSAADRRRFWSVTAAVIVADLVTKLIAETTLLRASSVSVIGDFFQLRLVYNPGAAFGLHLGEYSR